MRGLVATLEKHHKIRILDEAVVDAVRLSHRYISGRQLPDKSVSLLDTSAARVAIGLTTVPPAVEDCRRRIEQLDVALGIAKRENLTGANNQERIDELTQAKTAAETELAALEIRWKEESELVTKIREIREQLESGEQVSPLPTGEGPGVRAETGNGHPSIPPQRPKPTGGRTATAPATPPPTNSRPRSEPSFARNWPISTAKLKTASRRNAADAGLRRFASDRRSRLRLDRHSRRPHGHRRNPHRARP